MACSATPFVTDPDGNDVETRWSPRRRSTGAVCAQIPVIEAFGNAPAGNSPFGIRPATLEDVPAMCANVADGIASYAAWAPPGWSPSASAADAELVRERFSALGFTARITEDRRAHVAAHRAFDEPDAMHLLHLFVRPELQGSGVAAALLALIVAEAREGGARAMRLRTPASNARGLAFYRREGFTMAGPADGAGIGLPLVWMRRPL